MKKGRKVLVEYLGVFLGALITGAGLAWFMIPSRIAAGGVSGLAIVLNHLFQLPVGLWMLLLNLPLFLVSIKILGPVFGAKTVFGAVVVSLSVDIFGPFATAVTSDALLAAIYGGVVSGIGIGITFRYGGSTGGTDMAAQLIAKFFPTTVGQALLAVDGLVILLAGIMFGPELALYALLTVFIITKAIDLVQEGHSYAKAAFIISPKSKELTDKVMQELNRGVTQLQGRGAFTNSEKDVLFVIVSRREVQKLKDLTLSVDPQAFFVITDVHEVLGEGFKSL